MKSSKSSSTATAPTQRQSFEISGEGLGTTLIDPINGQAMHSRIGPMAEARIVYLEPSGLLSRWSVDAETLEPLVIYDIGLGIAANSIAVLNLYLSARAKGPLEILSFENQISGLATALQRIEAFPFLIAHREALETLLATQSWSHPQLPISWRLLEGDFRARIQEDLPPPELIFYDFYAPSIVPDLWRAELFSRLRKLAAPRLRRGLETRLCTYSAATPVRLGLLHAGFYVGGGSPTGAKLETTVASTLREGIQEPLDLSWLKRKRDGKKALPYGIADQVSERDQVWKDLEAHPQFQSPRP